jgi:putative transposase
VLQIPRSTLYRKAKERPPKDPQLDEELAREIKEILDDPRHAGYGYRRVWAVLVHDRKKKVNRKKVQRIMKVKGWQAKPITRPKRYGGGPYDRREVVVDPKQKIWTEKPDERWCTDLTRFYTLEDGWVNFIPVLDCFNSECVGWRLSRRGRALEAREALDQAVVNRFGDARNVRDALSLRTDNGSIFLAKEFFDELRRLRIEPEYTPYSCPQANGIAERFMRTLKEECVWQHTFANLEEAEPVIEKWITFYNTQRRHSRLGYCTPVQFRERLCSEAA